MDLEDRAVTLQGDERTICNVLDTLTCCCMQMAEILENNGRPDDGASIEAANSLHTLLKKSKKQAQLPTADQVEFWKDPEKAGWMYSQGEHIRTWRKRWFVLKQGFLFRFSDPDINASSKPRGIVDLSQVTDVTDGNSTTGKPYSLKLSTANGGGRATCYICESETAQVEWISALDTAVARIVKIVAGVVDDDDSEEEARRNRQKKASSSSSGKHRSSGGGGTRQTHGNGMVTIVNYGVGDVPGSTGTTTATATTGGGGGGGYVTVDYSTQIAGAQPGPPSYSNTGNSGGGGMFQEQHYFSGGGGGGRGGGGQYDNQYYYQQQQQQQPYGGGGGDVAPTGGGMTLMDTVTSAGAQQQHADGGGSSSSSMMWQVHYTNDGRSYYYNSMTGVTQWETPN